MLVAGSDDGVYSLSGVREANETTAERVLDSGRVFRVRQFDALDGIFVATESGLHHSLDGTAWTDLGVPQEEVYSVCASPSGERLYAGTRPAHVYVSTLAPPSDDGGPPSSDGIPKGGENEWHELDGFRDLRSREWRKSRHDDVAQVRSLCTHPDAPERVVAGVEVGGVHVSEDGGETWEARNEEGNDDVHHVHAVSAEEYVASTGFGLFRTEDAGRSWTRLDRNVEQRYFRESFSLDGVLYAGGAHGSSSSWEDESDHAVFERRDGRGLEAVALPVPDELVIGWCAMDGDVIAATHRGTLLGKWNDDWRERDGDRGEREDDEGGHDSGEGERDGGEGERDGDWKVVGHVPVPGEVAGRYLPLSWYEE